MRSTYLLLAALPLLCSGCTTFDQEGSMAAAYEAMGKGQYQNAIGRVARAKMVKPPTPALMAEMLFIHARADEGQKLFPQAKKHYQDLIKDFPDSVFAYMAAECLRRLEANQTLVSSPSTVIPPANAQKP